MKVRAVSRAVAAIGFELAGLAVEHAEDGRAAADAIARCMARADAGLLLVDEALYRELPRELLAKLDRHASPIVASVPTPRWDESGEAESYVMDILRQAIGYRVRVR
jgi:vacuolar-type H+-ATPase subunit F/Vma7